MIFRQIIAAALMISLALLVGCGGGGDGFVAFPPSKTPVLKGLWVGSQGTTSTSAIILANGDSWVVLQEAGVTTGFARLQTQTSGNSFTSTGNQYKLQTNTTESATSTGTFTEKTSLSGVLTTAGSSTNFNLTYDPRYETTASLSDAAGSWTGSFNSGSGTRTMNISATGALTGSSTTGCTYTGTVQPRTADPALFDLSLTETCVVGNSTSFSGIATVNAAKTSLSFAATTADKTSGALFVGTK